MIDSIRDLIKKNPDFFYPILFSLICLFLILSFYLVAFDNLPQKLPLFYSRPWGNSQLVFKSQFFILATIPPLVTLINILIASHLHPSQLVLKKILLGTIIFINLLILVTAFKILLIFI